MFEKDAEEYANEYGQDAFTQVNMPQWIKPIRMERKLGFQKGAEFGYNKANEWHYVKDEGTPKVEGHYLVCLRNKDMDIFDCWIYYDKDVGWYSMKVRMKDIYAWKEIVLPKESE